MTSVHLETLWLSLDFSQNVAQSRDIWFVLVTSYNASGLISWQPCWPKNWPPVFGPSFECAVACHVVIIASKFLCVYYSLRLLLQLGSDETYLVLVPLWVETVQDGAKCCHLMLNQPSP